MERDTLEEILAVEKEIREKLEGDRDEASRWLAGIRHEIEQVTCHAGWHFAFERGLRP